MTGEFLDIVIRIYPQVGYLPLVLDAMGKELYRGTHEQSPAFAVAQGIAFVNRQREEEGR